MTAFLASADTTKATRQRQLSALRKLAQMLYLLAPTDDAQRMMIALGMVKAPVDLDAGTEREGHALTPSQADKLLRAWQTDEPKQAIRNTRNRALVAVLLLTGVKHPIIEDKSLRRRGQQRQRVAF